MKKFFSSIIILVFSALAFSACQKEIAPVEEPQEQLVTITFTADKVAETRTAAQEGENSVSYVWTEEDAANIKLFIVGTEMVTNTNTGLEEEKEKLTEVENPVVDVNYSTNKMTITAAVAPNATYTFRAILCDPSSYTGSGNNFGTRKPKIKAEQYPDGNDNFDPTADILVTDDMEITVGDAEEGQEAATTGSLLMTFRRKVVINKMTLKNLIAGEKVEKVVITSLTETHGDIQGYLEDGVMKGQSNTITIKYTGGLEVQEGGQFPVYFVSMNNEDIALKVDVTTDQNTYTKSFAEGKSISFNLGQFTRFGFALPAGTPVTALPNGDYFITGVKDGDTYAATAYVSGNNLSNPLVITVDEANESISYVTDIEDCVFTFTRITDVEGYVGKYTIQDANGLYLYAAGGNGNDAGNHLKSEAAPDVNGNAYWTVEKQPDGTYSIESAGDATKRIMRLNPNNNNPPIFSCYGSGQNPITLYPASWCTFDTTPVFTIADDERVKDVTCTASATSFSYTANRYATVEVAIGSDPNSIIDGEPVVSNGSIIVTLNPNTDNSQKTATLSVSSNALDSPITLTINQAEYSNMEPGSESFILSSIHYSSASDNSVIWNGSSTTITLAKNTSGTKANNYLGGNPNQSGSGTYSSTRFYSNQKLTISPVSGYTITSIVFTATTSGYATALKNSSWTNANASVENTVVTVTPVDGTLSVSAIIGATCGFTQIVVNYLTEGGSSGNDEVNASLTESEIKGNITTNKCAYGTVHQYNDTADGINWYVDCNTDAANRPWMQLKSGSGYIRVVANGAISSLTITISNASNSSGGINDITKHGDFTGTVTLSTASSGGTPLGSGTPTNKSITLQPTGSPSEVYILTNPAARIWGVDVTYTPNS